MYLLICSVIDIVTIYLYLSFVIMYKYLLICYHDNSILLLHIIFTYEYSIFW